jgi:hypothetical protein
MKKALSLIIGSALLISLVAGMQVVKLAEANFVPYGTVSIISPSNQTYNSNFPILNFTATFSVTTTKSITYSIDGQPSVTITGLQYKGTPLWETTSGTVALPELSNGPHLLEMYAKTNSTPVLPGTGYSSVYFTINSTTQSQTPTISPSPSSTATASPSLAPSPSIPEFPSFIVLPFLMVAVLVGAIVYRRKPNNKNSISE